MKFLLKNQTINKRKSELLQKRVSDFRIIKYSVEKIVRLKFFLLTIAVTLFLGLFIINQVFTQENNTQLFAVLSKQSQADRVDIEKKMTGQVEVGSGLLTVNRVEDIVYVVPEGETLSEIAYIHNIDTYKLALYNNLGDLDLVKGGQKIIIPSQENLQKYIDTIDPKVLQAYLERERHPKKSRSLLPDSVVIGATTDTDGHTVAARFYIVNDLDETGLSFTWDLGNGQKSYRKKFSYTYEKAGTYSVILTVKDKYGNRLSSNKLYIDIPHPTSLRSASQRFVTVGAIGELFVLDGEIIEYKDYLGGTEKPFEFVRSEAGKYYYQTKSSGYFYMVAQEHGKKVIVYLFVSPFASKHSDRADINWYFTQFNTGLANCGPAAAAMGIAWAKGIYVPVPEIRDLVGWVGIGGTSFEELKKALSTYGVNSRYVAVLSPQEIFSIVDNGNVALVLYDCGSIGFTEGKMEKNLVGKYYSDDVGHYSIIKGYTLDYKYFVVYDPIPSDWGSNSKRYGDGVSMIGRNRYYLVEEFYKALKQKNVLEITRG